MIASLRGTVLSVGLTKAVIETGGVGMSIQATPTTLSGLRVGEETLVHTEMVSAGGAVRVSARTPAQRQWAAAQAAARRTGAVDPRRVRR